MPGLLFLGDDDASLGGVRALLFAGAITVLAALLQTMLGPVTHPFPLLFYFPAIGLAALYGGALAGLVAVVGCGFCAYHLAWPGPHAHVAAAIVAPPFVAYAVVAAGVVLVVHAIRGAFNRVRENHAELLAQLIAEKERGQSLQRRMASNMQAIASLLTLQKMKLRPESLSASRVLDDARQRVVDMSRINRRLNERDADGPGTTQYLQLLCADFQSAGSAHSIVCTTADDIDIKDPEKLMALSVLVGEAVGNAIKHAFDDNDGGVITVNLRRTAPTRCQLIVKDNGRGLAANVNPAATESSGFLIMQAMAMQLGGKLEILPSTQGTTLIVRFEL